MGSLSRMLHRRSSERKTCNADHKSSKSLRAVVEQHLRIPSKPKITSSEMNEPAKPKRFIRTLFSRSEPARKDAIIADLQTRVQNVEEALAAAKSSELQSRPQNIDKAHVAADPSDDQTSSMLVSPDSEHEFGGAVENSKMTSIRDYDLDSEGTAVARSRSQTVSSLFCEEYGDSLEASNQKLITDYFIPVPKITQSPQDGQPKAAASSSHDESGATDTNCQFKAIELGAFNLRETRRKLEEERCLLNEERAVFQQEKDEFENTPKSHKSRKIREALEAEVARQRAEMAAREEQLRLDRTAFEERCETALKEIQTERDVIECDREDIDHLRGVLAFERQQNADVSRSLSAREQKIKAGIHIRQTKLESCHTEIKDLKLRLLNMKKRNSSLSNDQKTTKALLEKEKQAHLQLAIAHENTKTELNTQVQDSELGGEDSKLTTVAKQLSEVAHLLAVTATRRTNVGLSHEELREPDSTVISPSLMAISYVSPGDVFLNAAFPGDLSSDDLSASGFFTDDESPSEFSPSELSEVDFSLIDTPLNIITVTDDIDI